MRQEEDSCNARSLGGHSRERKPRTAGHRAIHRRRIRRRAAGHLVSDAARLVAWDDCAVRRPIASSARSQARSARVRLRRPERAHAGPDVRSALPRLRGGGLHDSAAGQCRAGLAGRCSASRRSAVEERLRGQRAAAGSRRRRSPLANLFVHVARDMSPDAEGVERARSATEAFLYRGWRRCRKRPGFPPQRPLADSLRRLGANGSRSALCRGRLAIELDGRSIWPMRRPTVATGARTCSCRKTATSCCGSSPKTWASTSTRCSTPSCERCRTVEATESGESQTHVILVVGVLGRGLNGYGCGVVYCVVAAPSYSSQSRSRAFIPSGIENMHTLNPVLAAGLGLVETEPAVEPGHVRLAAQRPNQ